MPVISKSCVLVFAETFSSCPGGQCFALARAWPRSTKRSDFCKTSARLAPLIISPGISLAAAEHVADQVAGDFGHDGSDQSNPGERMNRHGTWSALWGENISYGKAIARDVVIALIIDDGLRNRKHRKNIFNPAFNYAGAAFGPHAHYRIVCTIDFAGGYAESATNSRSLLAARN